MVRPGRARAPPDEQERPARRARLSGTFGEAGGREQGRSSGASGGRDPRAAPAPRAAPGLGGSEGRPSPPGGFWRRRRRRLHFPPPHFPRGREAPLPPPPRPRLGWGGGEAAPPARPLRGLLVLPRPPGALGTDLPVAARGSPPPRSPPWSGGRLGAAAERLPLAERGLRGAEGRLGGALTPPPPPLCPADALHAALQPAGEAAPPEVVPGHLGQGQEEDGPGADAGGAGAQAQDVQLPGMAGPEGGLQKVCQLVLLLCHRGAGQRADHSGTHPSIRGAARQILRQCV